MTKNLLLGSILLLALLLRTVDFSNFTPGVYLDEASMAYDAYSINKVGTDQYGKSWPIYFRSFAMYQSPLYVYLSVVPIKLIGMNPTGIRIVSLVSGMLTILVFYMLIKLVWTKNNEEMGIIGAFLLSISPWHILFSRNALEANLGLFIFVFSIYLLFLSIAKHSKTALILGLILLGITNHAYHAYRVTSVLTAIAFLAIFWKNFSPGLKKTYVIGLVLFVAILIPQLTIINSAGSLRRYQLLQYTSVEYFNKNGDWYREIPGGRYLFISRAFLDKYFDYLSPKSIFFEEDPAVTKSIVELSSFYSWMFIFYCLGVVVIIRKYHTRTVMFFVFVGLISIIPSAVTTDNLYLLRILNYLLIVTLIVSVGLVETLKKVGVGHFRFIIISFLLIGSLVNLYINYFHLSKYERKGDYSGLFNELFEYTNVNRDKNYVVDLSLPFTHSIAMYVYKYDPKKYQEGLNFNLDRYYEETKMPTSYKIENLEIREIDWEKDVKLGKYIVGDEMTAPEQKAKRYGLALIKQFETSLDRHKVYVYK